MWKPERPKTAAATATKTATGSKLTRTPTAKYNLKDYRDLIRRSTSSRLLIRKTTVCGRKESQEGIGIARSQTLMAIEDAAYTVAGAGTEAAETASTELKAKVSELIRGFKQQPRIRPRAFFSSDYSPSQKDLLVEQLKARLNERKNSSN